MNAPLETRIDGDADTIEAVATWLRSTMQDSARTFTEATDAHRSRAAASWDAPASESFGRHIALLSDAGETLSTTAASQGLSLDTLAVALRAAQDHARVAREKATVAGLEVDGTRVHHPGGGPPAPIPLSGNTSPSAVDHHETALAEYNRHQDLVAAWNTAAEGVRRAIDGWDDAVVAAASRWQSNAGNLATLAHGFIAGGSNALSVAANVYATQSMADLATLRAAEAHSHVQALTNPDGTTRGPNRAINDYLNDITAAQYEARTARAALDDVGPSARVARIMNGLGIFATGYAIGDDLANGESIPQAVTSNAAGMAAGYGAGVFGGWAATAVAGAVAGSVVPGAGTVVGAAAGAVVGSLAAIATSGMVDSVWENGEFNGETFRDGGAEVHGTVIDAGGLVTDGWKALFD